MKDLSDKELEELILNKFDEYDINYGVSKDGKKLTWIDDYVDHVVDAVFKVVEELKK